MRVNGPIWWRDNPKIGVRTARPTRADWGQHNEGKGDGLYVVREKAPVGILLLPSVVFIPICVSPHVLIGGFAICSALIKIFWPEASRLDRLV